MTKPEFDTLRFDIDSGVATIHLHRPEKLNAFTPRMMADLMAAFDRTDSDDAVRCVIVTGSGRAFCAGADLSRGEASFDSMDGSDATGRELPGAVRRDGGGRLALRIFNSLKPVIAAVNGPAVGVGATMLLPMDIRVASANARFGFVFARRGIAPEACSSWFLPRLVGPQQSLEWIFSGRIFEADEALQGGLIRSVHEPADLLPAARALALEIAVNSAPVSVALSRRMIWRMLAASHPMDAHRADSRAIQSRGASADAREGVASFLEKRPAVWPDKVSNGIPDVFPTWHEPHFD